MTTVRTGLLTLGATVSACATLLRDTTALSGAEELAHFRLPEAAIAAGSPDAADTAGSGPPGDSLGIDAEQRRDLTWCEQALTHLHSSPSGLVRLRLLP
jgi:hypothetical protein